MHLDTIRGSRDFEHKAKALLYRNCPSKGISARLAAVPLGIASEGLGLAARVATTGEAVLKSALNIIGSHWRDDCSSRRGLKQLFFFATKSFVVIPFFPIIALGRLAKTTLLMLSKPEKLVKERILRHDPLKYYESKIDKIFTDKKRTPLAVTSFMLSSRGSLTRYYKKIAEIERSTPLVPEICREIAKVYSEMPAFEPGLFQDYNAGIYFENKRIGSNIENQKSVLKALVKLESLYTQLNLAKFQAIPDEEIILEEITRPSADEINNCKNNADTFYQHRVNKEDVSALLEARPKLVELRANYDRLNIPLGSLDLSKLRACTNILFAEADKKD